MATNNEYVVKITASTSEFNTQVTKSQKLAQAFHKTAQGMSASLSGIGTASRTAASGFTKISTSMKSLAKTSVTVNSALGGILKRLLAFASAGALAGFTKSCLDAGSALTEVQNVVDVTFGNMSDEINDFAQNAITQFGLSETSAKKYASTLGSIMKGMGVNGSELVSMSEGLTGLAADMASFKNLKPEEAFVKIQSAITGETEAIKSVGIVMTETNLKEYARRKGITEDISKMNQRNKVLLRYNYLMDSANEMGMIGDYARTSDSWANSVNTLAQSFEKLKATLGQGFIALFSPILKLVSALVQKLQVLAGYFSVFATALTGKGGVDTASSGASSGVDGLTDSFDSNTEAAENATKAAKEYKRSVMSFDELHKLSSQSSSSAADSDLGGGFDIGDLTTDKEKADKELTDFEKKLQDLARRLKNFWFLLKTAAKLGQWKLVGQMIADAFKKIFDWAAKKISWENVGGRITKFAKAVTDAANAIFASKGMWKSAGNFIAQGITTIAKTMRELLERTHWIDLGDSLGEMINTAITNTSWYDVGRAMMDKFMVGWKIFLGFIRKYDAQEGGKALGELFKGLVESFQPAQIGEAIGTAVTKLLETFNVFFDTKKDKIQELGRKIIDGITAFFKALDGKQIADAINNVLDVIFGVVGDLLKDEEFKSALEEDLKGLFDNLKWGNILKAGALIAGAKFAAGFATNFLAQISAKALGAKLANIILGGGASSTAASGAATGFVSAASVVLTGIAAALATLYAGLKVYDATVGQDRRDVYNGEGKYAGEANPERIKRLEEEVSAARRNLEEVSKWYKAGDSRYDAAIERLADAEKTLKEAKGDTYSNNTNSNNTNSNNKTTYNNYTYNTYNNTGNSLSSRLGNMARQRLGRFASGGFPDTGELYFARENGQELVGRIGNQNAVMNNEQIVSAVSSGVADAVASVMATFTKSGNDNGGDFVVQLGDEEIYRASMRGYRQLNNRENPLFAVG
jgi:hypothetical protein